MGPRPQGGVRCCLGKPFAPVTIVAPDAGRIWPAWSSSRGGNCCRIPRWDTRFPTSRSQAWPVRSPRGEAPIRSRWSSRTRARARSPSRSRWCPPRRLPSVNGSLVPPYYVPSSADAAASQIGIYLAPRPHSLAGAIEIGTATAQALSQNDIERFNVSLTLPQQLAGFRASASITSGWWQTRLNRCWSRTSPTT